jgi:hypothetical protein
MVAWWKSDRRTERLPLPRGPRAGQPPGYLPSTNDFSPEKMIAKA